MKFLNSSIENKIIKVRSFGDYYRCDFERSLVIPEERVEAPELATLPLYPRSMHMRGSSYTSLPAFVTTIKDVIYDPVSNLLLSSGREVFLESLLPRHPMITAEGRWNSGGMAGNGRPYWYNFHRNKIQTIPGVCAIFRGIYKAHFHSLISEMPRLFLLGNSDLTGIKRIKLLYADALSTSEVYFLPKLLPHGIELSPVKSDCLYRIEKLIFPSYLNQQSSGYLPQAYMKEFRQRILPKRHRSSKRRIFISRINYACRRGRRHILNEDRLFSMLQKHGFYRCSPEKMSIADQIELFFDARMVIGAHGSGLTNILFSDQADVIEMNPEFAVHPYFYLLSKSVAGRYKFWYARDVQDPDETKLFKNFNANVEEIMDLVSDGLSGS